MRPLIGINLDYMPAGKIAGAQTRLHAGYIDCVNQAEGSPILLAPVALEYMDYGLLDRLNGIILAGSPDCISQRRTKQLTHPSGREMNKIKEDFDFALAQYAVSKKLPILAIANGMLELNLVTGGTNYAYIAEDMPKALPHKDITGGPHRHAINILPKTQLDKIYDQPGEIRVNSYHSQAVHKTGPGFKVCAMALDSVIEAIEPVDPLWFCIGVQWHPHSETSSALDINLFKAFIHAADERFMSEVSQY